MIEGKIEDWSKTHKLALRTELGTGEYTNEKSEKVPMSFSMNIDGKAIFLEFPNSVKVTYRISDMIEDAIKLHEEWKERKQ